MVDNAGVSSLVRLANGISLSCVDQGERSPVALVFLPGPTDSWVSYAPVLDRILGSVRCVAVSQRGHGDSDKPEQGYAITDFAADVPLLLDALGIERAVLVAHSGSTLTARRVALDRPDRVVGLVLEASPTTLAGNQDLSDFVASVIAPLTDPVDPEFARAFVVDTSAPAVDPDLVDELVREAQKVPARVWHETFAGLLTYDDLAELRTLAVPTLLVWGDGDGLVSRAMQDDLLDRMPNATLTVYDGIGHTPRWEDPARFATDVAAFAQSINLI